MNYPAGVLITAPPLIKAIKECDNSRGVASALIRSQVLRITQQMRLFTKFREKGSQCHKFDFGKN